jgi:ElaB/YqjD/DUF883 family membrane-anchored ribosome-binding protein
MSAEQKSPEELREEIAGTREELGDTVEALAGKADVKGQAKAKVASAKEKAQDKLSSAHDAAPESVSAGAQRIADRARSNPLPVALAGAFAAGIAVGWILSR